MAFCPPSSQRRTSLRPSTQTPIPALKIHSRSQSRRKPQFWLRGYILSVFFQKKHACLLTRSRHHGTVERCFALSLFTSINPHHTYFQKVTGVNLSTKNQRNVGCTFKLQYYQITTRDNMDRPVKSHVIIVSTKLRHMTYISDGTLT